MFATLFYLSVVWLAMSFVLVMLFGTRWRTGNFLVSALYFAIVVQAGTVIALWLSGPTVETVVVSALVMGAAIPFIAALPDWTAPGQAFFFFALVTTAVYLLYALAVTAFSPLSPIAFVFSYLLLGLETAALTLSLTYAFEVLDVLCRTRWKRRVDSKPFGDYAPWVSLHVPAYNEPPELVEQTLRALSKLDYPNYEVILVDNNTPDEKTWHPLAAVCREYGFKCLHLDRWPGYKSGALNFALAMTDPRAEIIGVIDSDYIVQPEYLRRIVPYFEDRDIAFVQTPQDYREFETNRFFQAAYDGYRYFFSLSMPARNERNAIIFCGTMGLLRKSVLQEIGGWDEWCITEDAEASLRILNRGYQSLFVDESFGRGLMPLNFEGLKKQRFRWTFGGVQILKKHWSKLMPWAHWLDPENRLTASQRYFYLVAGLQWFNELLTFAFTVVVLISAILTIAGQTALLRPAVEAFVVLPIVLIGTNMLRALWGLRQSLSISWRRSVYALTLWFSLTWVVALACVQAVVRERGVFLRTPKARTNSAWARALHATSWEATLAAACVVGGLGALVRSPSGLTAGLLLLCLSQAAIYASAPAHSLLSLAGAPRRAREPDRGSIYGSYANEARLGVQIGLAAAVLLAVAFAAALWPAPAKPPAYTALNPQPIIPQALPTSTQPSSAQPQPVAPIQAGNSATPTPPPTAAPSPTPSPDQSPPTTGTATPSATPTPGATATPEASPMPDATPSPAASRTPAATSSPNASSTATATPTPTRTPTQASQSSLNAPAPAGSPDPPPTPCPTPFRSRGRGQSAPRQGASC